MNFMRHGTLVLAILAATGSATAGTHGPGPWQATASHTDQSSSQAVVASVVGDGPSNGVFTATGPGATRPSRGAVSSSSTTGEALASLERYSITLVNPVAANPSEDSGSFLDTLTNFQSKTGVMSGSYTATFTESSGVTDSTVVVGGGLGVEITIHYAHFADVSFSDFIDFGKSDCPFVGDECRTARTFGFLEVPTSITVGMDLASRNPGGVNQAPHFYAATLELDFGEILPCGDGVFCTTPVAYDAAGGPGSAGVVPEPATWNLILTGLGLVGGSLRRRRFS